MKKNGTPPAIKIIYHLLLACLYLQFKCVSTRKRKITSCISACYLEALVLLQQVILGSWVSPTLPRSLWQMESCETCLKFFAWTAEFTEVTQSLPCVHGKSILTDLLNMVLSISISCAQAAKCQVSSAGGVGGWDWAVWHQSLDSSA